MQEHTRTRTVKLQTAYRRLAVRYVASENYISCIFDQLNRMGRDSCIARK